MKKAYDFSKGERDKFYRPDVKLNSPIDLDAQECSMQTLTLDKVIEDVKTLPQEEIKQLRSVLDDLLERKSKEEEVERLLLEAGLISEIKKPKRSVEAFRKYKPIKVKGKPVSETLIEERR